ncbi:hypothetical protein F0562_029871 [Nyssa sinensis]|uniref:Uncharacterized protein n=1 Tax=Nyssa sinensis TaxID=561372 RepID=A0A5J5AVF7_9ASTE|nr:hypothetical protein F0562_029871 [Nyssa sinensis]
MGGRRKDFEEAELGDYGNYRKAPSVNANLRSPVTSKLELVPEYSSATWLDMISGATLGLSSVDLLSLAAINLLQGLEVV